MKKILIRFEGGRFTVWSPETFEVTKKGAHEARAHLLKNIEGIGDDFDISLSSASGAYGHTSLHEAGLQSSYYAAPAPAEAGGPQPAFTQILAMQRKAREGRGPGSRPVAWAIPTGDALVITYAVVVC